MSQQIILSDQQRISIAKNNMADSAVTMGESLALGTIYTMFFTPLLHAFLEEIGKFFLFPLVAAMHVGKMFLAWRHAKLDEWRSRSVVPAVVESVAAAAVIAAVVGGLVSGLFIVATPIIFTAMLGGKMLYHAFSALYYAGKAAASEEGPDKRDYKERAIKNGLAAVAGAVATAAVACVFVFGIYAVAALGVVAVVMVGILAAVKGYQSYKASKAPAAGLSDNIPESEPSSGLTIARRLGMSAGGLHTSQKRRSVSSEEATLVPAPANDNDFTQSPEFYQQDGSNEDTQPLLSASPGK